MIESAWPKYPGYAISLDPLLGTGRARVGDILIAESSGCVIVRESDHVAQLYFPRSDVDEDLLIESGHHTICPFKGEASYAGLRVGDARFDDVMWWYPEPMDEVSGLDGLVAFYDDRIEVTAAVPIGEGDEATVKMPMWGTAGELAALMDVEPAGDGAFVAPTFPDPPLGSFLELPWHGRRRDVIEGGQLLGAAIVAASKSRPDQRVTTAHMAFLRAASFDSPLELSVDARRSGSTISAFDITIDQQDKLRASGLVMCDTGAEDLIGHVAEMPDVAGPEDSPTHDHKVLGRETRVVDDAYRQHASSVGPPELYVWTRFAADPGPQHLHQALVAQPTTHYTIGAALRAHEGVTEEDAHITVSMGPVNATISFHDEIDVTDWHLTETRSVWAGRGSTQSQVLVWARDGRLVASKTVQAIIRAFHQRPQEIGRDYSSAM